MIVNVNKNEFYVINISNRNVSLRDLYLTIPKYKKINLLSKHYNYTLDQLIKSATSGSLYKKRNKILLINKTLKEESKKNNLDDNSVFKSRTKSNFILEPEVYDELLNVSDEVYVNELIEDE